MREKIIQSLLVVMLIAGYRNLSAQSKDLDYYIGSGIQKSPLLNDLRNQSRSTAIDSMRINAGYKPQVMGVSNNSYAPSINGWGYDNAITNGGTFSQLITVNKRLVGKENLQNQYEAIRLAKESLAISGKVTEQDIRKAITSQYIVAYGIYLQYSFNKEVLELLGSEEAILKKLTERNIYRQTDYLSFLVTMQQQQLQLNQLKVQFQNEFASLNYLSGLQDTGFVAVPAPNISLAPPPEIEQTVFYQQFRLDSLKLKNSDAQINFSYKPKLSLYADAGHSSTFAVNPYKNFGTSFGINLSVPIYDGKQKKMQHDKIAIAQQTRQQYQQFYKTQFDQQLLQLLQQLRSAQELINQTSTQIRYTQALIEANRKLLEAGDVRMSDYIIAIGNYLAARNSSTQNMIYKLQLINQINYWNRKT
ncbi:Outer membrane protein TolC [Hydrobacter penzbergensis]|uniref:Outer membrane protein TolC n=1 Tax=Hydrobacter penzbergensis TaxID=1235997 RepID=A0A8X8ICF9_9BACT|nr:TolC family protein [Hydrobacter penzbergensis]SDW91670.1 Outer membrane protein TolC [Hydrobacter penzbergensis]